MGSNISNNISKINRTTSKELKARIERASLLEKFQIAQENSGHNSSDNYFMANIFSIMEELETTVATCSLNERENIIQLQLSDIVDKFIRTLKHHEQIIYIRRYFYVDTVENIAASCDLSADKIRTVINKCNENLNATLKEKNYLANTESLFQCFADINDDLISFGSNVESINDYLSSPTNKSVKKLNMRLNKYTVGITAIFVIAIVVILTIFTSTKDTPDKPDSDTSENFEGSTSDSGDYDIDDDYNIDIGNGIDISDYMHIFGEDEDGTYVITQELISYEDTNALTNITFNLIKNNCNISYNELILTIDTSILKNCIGTLYEYSSTSTKKYYTLLGHDDFHYMILEQDGIYTLLKLAKINPLYSFRDDTFENILRDIYGIENADDIEKILIAPISTDLNIDLKPETLFCVDDYDNIEYTCKSLKSMGFSTADLCETSQYGYISISALHDLSMRFLIYTKKGGLITSLFYNFSEHYFYDSNGTQYSSLNEDSSQRLDKIFRFSDIINNADIWNPQVHKLSVDAYDIKSTSVSLYYKNYNTPINGLYVSNWYRIEQLVDDTWVSVTPQYKFPSNHDTNVFQKKIPENGTGMITLNWASTYGKLPLGQYRIITSVCNLFTYNTQNHVEQLYYTEFTID